MLPLTHLTDLLCMSSRQTATKHREVLRETKKNKNEEKYCETELLYTSKTLHFYLIIYYIRVLPD